MNPIFIGNEQSWKKWCSQLQVSEIAEAHYEASSLSPFEQCVLNQSSKGVQYHESLRIITDLQTGRVWKPTMTSNSQTYKCNEQSAVRAVIIIII